MNRRTYMEGVASLAAARWAGEDYDIENVDEWDAPDGLYTTGEFAPESLRGDGRGQIGEWCIRDRDLTDRTVTTCYDERGVNLFVEGSGGELSTGCSIKIAPDTAKELAAALYQAAEEFEKRPGTVDTEAE